MSANTSANSKLVIAAFASIYLIWGSTYLAILVGLETIPPFILLGSRFFVAGLLLLVWRLMLGERASGSAIRQHSFAGVLMLFGGTGAVVWVEQYISSGLAAIIVASMPFWFVLLDYKQWAFNFSNGLIISGILVGFAGVIYLFGPGNLDFSQGLSIQLFSMLVLIAGCIAWASGSLYLKYRTVAISTAMGAGVQMFAAGVFSLLVGLQQGEFADFSWGAVSAVSWAGLLYLISFGSLLGYLSYVWLLKQRPTVQVGTYAYVNPVVALLLGWMIAAEPFAWQQLAALGLILCGVLLINFPKYRDMGRRLAVSSRR